jgi:Xaa-Pro aminopeptidase
LRRVTLFVPARDPRFESRGRRNDFPGRPLQTDPELGWRSGIDHIVDAGAFEAQLADWARRRRTLRVDAGFRGQLAVPALTPIQTWSPEQHMIAAIARMAPGVKLISASADVARLVRAVEETAAHIGPGVDERSLEGDLEAAFKRGGGQRLPFASIIKSGPNALWPWRILAADSDRRNRRMQAGEIVIFDVGVELNHYTSDVGRTFPVSGRFSDEQRRLLEMEARVADAIINAMRPGTTLAALQRVADAAIPEGERPYMQTPLYFGHHIGLSSGDPSLPGALLEPGMIITVEPWYYNHDRGISVFTEDDLLITGDGAENLTAALPRTPEALEHLVRR